MLERARRAIAITVSLAVILTGPAAAVARAQAWTDGTCVVRITRFVWEPTRVHAGDHAKLVLRAKNCTDQTVEVSVTEYGKQIPPCPTLDPIGSSATIEPKGHFRPDPLRLVAPSCDGVEVVVVKLFGSDGAHLARASATLHITTG